jgi:hypothetical protein
MWEVVDMAELEPGDCRANVIVDSWCAYLLNCCAVDCLCMLLAYGGPCDQFGAYCRMWEVVDMAELEPVQPGNYLTLMTAMPSCRLYLLCAFVLGCCAVDCLF